MSEKRITTYQACCINSLVMVKLNSYGIAILKELHIYQNGCRADSPLFEAPPVDENGFSRWRMWELMHVYGGSMGQGLAAPWDGDMFLVKESIG